MSDHKAVNSDVTKITSLDDGIDFFNEFIAGDIKTPFGEALHTPKIDKRNPS